MRARCPTSSAAPGIVVPAGDAAALADALAEAAGPRAAELRASGLARAEECSWAAVGRDYLDLYRAVRHGHPLPDPPATRPVEVIVVAYGSPTCCGGARARAGAARDRRRQLLDPRDRRAVRRARRALPRPRPQRRLRGRRQPRLADRLVPGADVLLLNPDADIDAADVERCTPRCGRDPTSRASARPRSTTTGQPARVEWPFPRRLTWLEAIGLGRLRRGPRT